MSVQPTEKLPHTYYEEGAVKSNPLEASSGGQYQMRLPEQEQSPLQNSKQEASLQPRAKLGLEESLTYSEEFRNDTAQLAWALGTLNWDERKGFSLNREHPFVNEVCSSQALLLTSDESPTTVEQVLYPIAKFGNRRFLILAASGMLYDPLNGEVVFDPLISGRQKDRQSAQRSQADTLAIVFQQIQMHSYGDAVICFSEIENMTKDYRGINTAVSNLVGALQKNKRASRLTLVFPFSGEVPEAFRSVVRLTTDLPRMEQAQRKEWLLNTVNIQIKRGTGKRGEVQKGETERYVSQTGTLSISDTVALTERALNKNKYIWDEGKIIASVRDGLDEQAQRLGLTILESDRKKLIPLVGYPGFLKTLEEAITDGRITKDYSLHSVFMLMGAAGLGKSYGAQYCLTMVNRRAYQISSAKFQDMYVGQGPKNVVKYIDLAEIMNAGLIFDDISFKGLASSAYTSGGSLDEVVAAIQTRVQRMSDAWSRAILFFVGNTLEGTPDPILSRAKGGGIFFFDTPTPEEFGVLLRAQIEKLRINTERQDKIPRDKAVIIPADLTSDQWSNFKEVQIMKGEGFAVPETPEDFLIAAAQEAARKQMIKTNYAYVGRQVDDDILKKAIRRENGNKGSWVLSPTRLTAKILATHPECNPQEEYQMFKPWAHLMIDAKTGLPLTEVIDFRDYRRIDSNQVSRLR